MIRDFGRKTAALKKRNVEKFFSGRQRRINAQLEVNIHGSKDNEGSNVINRNMVSKITDGID